MAPVLAEALGLKPRVHVPLRNDFLSLGSLMANSLLLQCKLHFPLPYFRLTNQALEHARGSPHALLHQLYLVFKVGERAVESHCFSSNAGLTMTNCGTLRNGSLCLIVSLTWR